VVRLEVLAYLEKVMLVERLTLSIALLVTAAVAVVKVRQERMLHLALPVMVALAVSFHLEAEHITLAAVVLVMIGHQAMQLGVLVAAAMAGHLVLPVQQVRQILAAAVVMVLLVVKALLSFVLQILIQPQHLLLAHRQSLCLVDLELIRSQVAEALRSKDYYG
jgi:hypothetical protein